MDRSLTSHPPDPNNPLRFRRNGGGVLLAIRNDLDLTCKQVKLNSGAEIIAVEFTTTTGLKFIICTCYRVGTLGRENLENIKTSLSTLLKRRRLSKIFFIGDLNFPGIAWNKLKTSDPLEQSSIDMFTDLGLAQMVFEPTHVSGNTLDILLMNSTTSISNLKVGEKDSFCRSDHFPIQFEIKAKVQKRKPVKRISYNFKTANWDMLNHALSQTNWDAMLSCTEPDIGWKKFKDKVFEISDKYMKKSHVKNDGQDPWFDSECYDAFRNKMRLHKNRKNSDNDNLKFSLARKKFKKIVAQKMRETLHDDDDSSLITKKFWSYAKSKSGSQRIPEFVSYKGVVRNNSEDQANLFNKFFFEQFSDESSYNIDISYDNDSDFDIDFSPGKVQKLLETINT